MTTFTVSGYGPFPISMLRFDECWPVNDTDANRIEASFNVASNRETSRRWSIELRTEKREAPTIGRWDSFNVRVHQSGED
jgi:hypothetical protein